MPRWRDIEEEADLEGLYTLAAERHVRANFVTSLDGAVELDGRSGSLSRPADRAAFMAMRAVADAILVGAGTAGAERYGPVRLDESAQRRRTTRDQEPLPQLAIVSGHAALDPQIPVLVGGANPILITSAEGARLHPEMEAVADVMVCGDRSVDLHLALERLAERGLGRVLCEGGPALFRSLLGNGLVDELCLTTAPVVAGSGHRGLTGDEPLPAGAQFELLSLLEGDGLLLARYGRV